MYASVDKDTSSKWPEVCTNCLCKLVVLHNHASGVKCICRCSDEGNFSTDPGGQKRKRQLSRCVDAGGEGGKSTLSLPRLKFS